MKFLLGGKRETHKVYEEIIGQHILRTQNYVACDDSFYDVIDAYNSEKKNRRTLGKDIEFYHDKQLHHFLADLFGAGLDTTLATLR